MRQRRRSVGSAFKQILSVVSAFLMVITILPAMGGAGRAKADEEITAVPAVTVGWIDENGYQNTVWLDKDAPYYVNGSETATNDSSVEWNAYYNAEKGLLTYRNYHGAGIDIREKRGNVAIDLIGENYIGGKGQFGIYVQDELFISSESWGTLTVDTGTDFTSYGLRTANDSIFIGGTADVKVKVTASGGAYAVKSGFSVVICENASLSMEAYSVDSGSAFGIAAEQALMISTPYKVTYKGESADLRGAALSGLTDIRISEGSRMSLETNGSDENCIYSPVSKLHSMLGESGFRALISEESGVYYAVIEPKTHIMSPIDIEYDQSTLPNLNMFMTGAEAYANYLDALQSPTEENYNGEGFYIDTDSGWSGISDDPGDGANLNGSTELLEYGEPYYIMFDVVIDEDLYLRNNDQLFQVNSSTDYLESTYTDSGKEHYLISILQIAGYGPPKTVYIKAYNTVIYASDDMVSFDDTSYSYSDYKSIPQGEEIKLYAKAGEESEFLEWRKGDSDGEIIGTDPVITVTVLDAVDYYAVFQRKIPASGKLSDTVDYTFDEATGTVTLIPTGDDGEGGPYGVASVGGWQQSPFYKNTKVKNVVVQEGIVSMDAAVFEENNLETVSLPASITGINSRAFEDCSFEGAGFTVAPGNEGFFAVDGNLFADDGKTMYKFVKAPGQTEFTIPDGVTHIIGECFSHTSLDLLTLRGEGLWLESYALDWSTIGEVIIEEGVETIDYQRCELLSDTIMFPSTVTFINSGGFIDGSNLTNIHVISGNPNYESIDGVIYEKLYKDGEYIGLGLLKYPNGRTETSFTVSEGILAVGGTSMQNPNLTEIVLPESVSSIVFYAFAYRYENPVTVQISNPNCEIEDNVFEYCNNVTLKGMPGSTAHTFAEEHGFTFVPMDGSFGQMPAPKNVRWDGTTAKWDPVPGMDEVRYNIKFYDKNDDGTLYHVSSLDQVITDGSTEWDGFRQRMFYTDEEYFFTVSASKVGYDTSKAVQSPAGKGVLDHGTTPPEIERDTLKFATNASREIPGVDYFWSNISVWNSSDEMVYDEEYLSSDDPAFNLRDKFATDSLPYGTYKIKANLYAYFYGWSVKLADSPEDFYIYYDFQPVSAITRIEVTLPRMIEGMRSYDPAGLEIKSFSGSEQVDGVHPSPYAEENRWEYAEEEGGSFKKFADDKLEKGKYQYAYKLSIDKWSGYTFADDVEIFVNGTKEGVKIIVKEASYYNIRYYYPVGTQPAVELTEANTKIAGIKAKTYNGKYQTQKLAVTADGVKLTEGTDYKLTYQNNKDVGKAAVTITGIGDYVGSVRKNFAINPQKTSLSTLTPAKKALTVKWKVQKTKMSTRNLKKPKMLPKMRSFRVISK